MSTDDNIFLATDESLADVAEWLSETLGLERADGAKVAENAHLFRGRTRTVDGNLFVRVEPNIYGEGDPAPEDVSAIDRYQGVVDIRYAGRKDEDLQAREARALFDELVERGPDVAMVLSHNLSLIVAAYLPGAGAHYFPAGTTLDVPDDETWRPWIVT